MSYREEILVSLGGPAVNFVIFLVFIILARCFAFSEACFFATVNLSLCLINLLPAFPLDGSRVLYCFLANYSLFAAEMLRKLLSFISAVIVFALGVILFLSDGFHFSLILIGFYLLISCITLERYAKP